MKNKADLVDNTGDGVKIVINVKTGDYTIVEPQDVKFLEDYQWYKAKNGYIYRSAVIKGKFRRLYFHRFILEESGMNLDGLEVDHVNRIKHDNRRTNLRPCTPAENKRNRTRKSDTGYKGVTFNPRTGLYTARVQIENRNIFIGSFPNARMAAYYYNQAASQLHGEFAQLNNLNKYTEKEE